MNTEPHNTGRAPGQEPTHSDVSFEPRDVGVTGALRFLILLGVAIAASYFVCLAVYKLTLSDAARVDSPPPPVRQGIKIQPPSEPRLQGVPIHPSDPQKDLREKIAADRKALEETRWLDQKAGVAQIPIEDAMRIVAEKGLPAVPSAVPGKKK